MMMVAMMVLTVAVRWVEKMVVMMVETKVVMMVV